MSLTVPTSVAAIRVNLLSLLCVCVFSQRFIAADLNRTHSLLQWLKCPRSVFDSASSPSMFVSVLSVHVFPCTHTHTHEHAHTNTHTYTRASIASHNPAKKLTFHGRHWGLSTGSHQNFIPNYGSRAVGWSPTRPPPLPLFPQGELPGWTDPSKLLVNAREREENNCWWYLGIISSIPRKTNKHY